MDTESVTARVTRVGFGIFGSELFWAFPALGFTGRVVTLDFPADFADFGCLAGLALALGLFGLDRGEGDDLGDDLNRIAALGDLFAPPGPPWSRV